MKNRKVFLLTLCVLMTILWIGLADQVLRSLRSVLPSLAPRDFEAKSVKPIEKRANPWDGTPQFALYVRFSSSQRWENEFKNVLLRTMKIFFPQEKVKLLAVLDNEKKEDHKLGARISKEWPHPDICYRDPGNPTVYHNWGKARMFWDMMHPDECTNLPYVGYVDTDTFFDTLVTPNLLFETRGKSLIFSSYTLFEITKKSHTKITKSQTNHMQKAQKITNH